jgi:hypothetical protein
VRLDVAAHSKTGAAEGLGALADPAQSKAATVTARAIAIPINTPACSRLGQVAAIASLILWKDTEARGRCYSKRVRAARLSGRIGRDFGPIGGCSRDALE